MPFGEKVMLAGVGLDAVTEAEVVAAVLAAMARGEGGRIVTPNVDILRLARVDPAANGHLTAATIVVADGMPLVWAARLAGTPLPGRVAGANLIWSLSYHLGRAGRSIYLLGGTPGAADPDGAGGDAAGPGGAGGDAAGPGGAGGDAAGSGARRAAAVLCAACPGLPIAGMASPPYGFETDPQTYAAVRGEVIEAKPDLVFVGLGFPKQEQVIDALRPDLPLAWFLGCGAAIGFVAGETSRAPRWMQRSGLEWLWRLGSDPHRLARRYLRHDAPFALHLLGSAIARSHRAGSHQARNHAQRSISDPTHDR